MSGIAGVIYQDGRPAHVTDLAPAREWLEPMGPDQLSTWAEGNAAFVHYALHTTPEAEYERWPLCHPRGDILLADARIDNREELIRTLRPEPRANRPITDADLILAAHERWGEEAPAHLVGDFAYVLWTPKEQTLLMVRSPFGMKSLYYRQTANALYFGTSMRAVRALAPENLTVNMPSVAGFLTRKLLALADQTVFCEIIKVTPAHTLRFNIAKQSQIRQQFWDLRASDVYSSWSDKDWIEAFKEHFETAVAASLRTNHPLTISVSGGLDSSSIALVAHRLMHQEQRLAHIPVHTLTMRMKEWPETDESEYRNAVIERLPHFRHEWLDVDAVWKWSWVESWNRCLSAPTNLPNAFTFQPRIERSHQNGCRAVLSGAGGDIITGGEDYSILEAWESLSWRYKSQEWRYFAHSSRARLRLIREWFRIHAPSSVRDWWRKRPSRRHQELFSEVCEKQIPKQSVQARSLRQGTPLQKTIHRVVTSPYYWLAFEQNAEIMALHGLEYRAPFYDRRLVELAFQQPVSLRIRQGNTRWLQKQALKNDLPPLLLTRTSKADFTAFAAGSISEADHKRASMWSNLAPLTQYQFIDPSVWQQWTTSPECSYRQRRDIHRVAHIADWLTRIMA